MSYNASPAGTGQGGKSAGGMQTSAGGYQPTQQAQQQFQSGVAQQQPDTAQQLNQISGLGGPAVSTMVNQQMAPQGATGPAPQGMNTSSGASALNTGQAGIDSAAQNLFNQYGSAMGAAAGSSPQDMYNTYASQIFGAPGSSYQPNFGAPMGMGASPIGLPNGQQLDLGGDQFVNNMMQQNQQIAQTQQQNFNALPAVEQQQRLSDQANFLKQQQQAQQGFFTNTLPPSPVVSPLAKAAPMPTKATQGYQTRLAPKPVARPAPVKQPIKLNTAPKRVK